MMSLSEEVFVFTWKTSINIHTKEQVILNISSGKTPEHYKTVRQFPQWCTAVKFYPRSDLFTHVSHKKNEKLSWESDAFWMIQKRACLTIASIISLIKKSVSKGKKMQALFNSMDA